MMKHIIAISTLFIPLTRANIIKRFDDSIDDNLFLSQQGSPDDLLDFVTPEPIASVPDDCHAKSDIDDDLFSSDIARVRSRQDNGACLPPLPPNIINLYDSTQILNILSGDDSLPGTPGTDNSVTEEKNSIFPNINTDTVEELKDNCPNMMGKGTHPVCSSGNPRRDNLRYPGEYQWTLFNVRYCMSPQSEFLLNSE